MLLAASSVILEEMGLKEARAASNEERVDGASSHHGVASCRARETNAATPMAWNAWDASRAIRIKRV